MNIWFYAALSIFPLGGLFLVAWGARNVWRGVASASWPQASGVVIASGVAENTSSDTTSSTVTVAYKVNGREYKTETMHFGESVGSSDPSDAEMARLRYPPGAEVSVAYHPQNPALAAVKPGFAAEALPLPVFGLALVLICAMSIVAFQSSGMNDIFTRAGGAILMLIGVALLSPGVRHLVRASESLNWPKAPGVILFSTITEILGTQRNENRYNFQVVAEYEVNGRKHYSKTRRFGQIGSGSDAEEAAERYPTGAKVQVSYSPADPDLSVLEPGITIEAYTLPSVGAVCFLFGLPAVLGFGFRL